MFFIVFFFDRNHFRAIIAGGGTGSVTVYFGEQLNDTNGEIVYMDFSFASMKITQRRAKARKLRNIIYVNSWIEGIRFYGLGQFKIVQCSGVLHHLKNPSLGLNILKDLSISNGGMDLMVYAQTGRTAIYMLQNLMRRINSKNDSINHQLQNTNKTLNSLPNHHWFKINTLVNDHEDGDIGR